MNFYKQLIDLIPDPSLQVGTVTAYTNGLATIELPGGGTIKARGSDVSIGYKVYVRDGIIEGPAPSLPVEIIEV